MLVSAQPYLKHYHFPLLSLATLIRLALLAAALALPFFAAYATPSTPRPIQTSSWAPNSKPSSRPSPTTTTST
jgi:hypothetical protein